MTLRTLRNAALPLSLVAILPSAASAQESPAPATVTAQETWQATGPSWAMVGSGLALFGISYTPALVVGASSGLEADRTLFVPLAGPWIDLTQRPGCSPATSCNEENTDKVLLVIDGVLQAIGAVTTVSGLLTTAHSTKTVVRSATLGPTLRVSPSQIDNGGYGLLASGTF